MIFMNAEEENGNTAEVIEEKPLDLSKAEAIFDELNIEKRYLIPVLQRIQEAYRFLPDEIMDILGEKLEMTRAQIYGIISFYPGLMITEPGKYILKVCMGTACFVKGAELICQKIDEQYHIGVGETDQTKLFTLQTASCMGNCGAAPILVVGEDFYGNIEVDSTLDTLGNYKND
tara:strand:- start:2676 stop:3197 length:522 start_codon:yes stop_codon:yes gene_type:complete